MALNKKTYRDKCPVFNDLGRKWLTMQLPREETTIGEKYSLRFKKYGSSDKYSEYVTTLYFDRFTDGHILDIPMDNFNVKTDEWFEIEATKIDK